MLSVITFSQEKKGRGETPIPPETLSTNDYVPLPYKSFGTPLKISQILHNFSSRCTLRKLVDELKAVFPHQVITLD